MRQLSPRDANDNNDFNKNLSDAFMLQTFSDVSNCKPSGNNMQQLFTDENKFDDVSTQEMRLDATKRKASATGGVAPRAIEKCVPDEVVSSKLDDEDLGASSVSQLERDKDASIQPKSAKDKGKEQEEVDSKSTHAPASLPASPRPSSSSSASWSIDDAMNDDEPAVWVDKIKNLLEDDSSTSDIADNLDAGLEDVDLECNKEVGSRVYCQWKSEQWYWGTITRKYKKGPDDRWFYYSVSVTLLLNCIPHEEKGLLWCLFVGEFR